MIQVLTYSGRSQEFLGENLIVNSLRTPQSLDEFDINIISLQDENIWCSKRMDTTTIDIIDDFKSLSKMLKNSVKAQNIILYPQNYKFYYNTTNSKNYWKNQEIKNVLRNVCGLILSELFMPMATVNIAYENTTTSVMMHKANAAFYFEANQEIEEVTKSAKSDKITTIRHGKMILSTLKLETYKDVTCFLEEIGLIQEKEKMPEWMKEVKMFDDERQFDIIKQNSEKIRIANENISEAMKVIDKNNEYKSILYTSGDELVNTVFEILEEMLGCDLSKFQDKKREDFNFKINNTIFVGEIKGVTPNVKTANVSQLDVHVRTYLDEHEELEENVVSLLIINHQRNKSLALREPVHPESVRIAQRNGSLIVETITLLKIFEKYLSGEMTREECLDILTNNSGLLSI